MRPPPSAIMERNTDFVITIGDSVFNRTTCSTREVCIMARAPSALMPALFTSP